MSNTRRAIAAGSAPASTRLAASASTSGVVASNLNDPVSVAMPTYRHVAMSASRRTPTRSSSRAETTAVAAASGSIRGTVPNPALDVWWSSTSQCGAASSDTVSAPRRAGLAASKLMPSAGRGAAEEGSTSRSRPGRKRNGSGRSNGSGNVACTAVKPSWRKPNAKPSMLPRASPSGLTWQVNNTGASRGTALMTSAARTKSAIPPGWTPSFRSLETGVPSTPARPT